MKRGCAACNMSSLKVAVLMVFLGLSLNDRSHRTYLFLLILVDKTVSVR